VESLGKLHVLSQRPLSLTILIQQTFLAILSRAFSPFCEISLCITYKLPDGYGRKDSFPLRYFRELEDGTHTLRNEIAPMSEAAIREYAAQRSPILPFDLSINYAQHEDVTPKALVAVKYRPATLSNGLSATNTASTQEILDCDFYREEMEVAYLSAREAAREAAANGRI
jgi:hypothetical protein